MYNINDIMALRPCYTREQVATLFGGRESVTVSEIAGAPIPHADRVWVLVRLATPQTRVLWACECAERALIREREAGREPDSRSWRAVDVARAWARGETTQDDAWAAWAAEAAEAAEEAAEAAAYAAWARESEREWQIARLAEMMESGDAIS